jgi:hypothetical protein
MIGRITILAALAAPLASAQSELPEARFLRVDYTFRDAGIPRSQIRQITAQIEKTSFDAPDSWEQELRIRRVALGQADVLVVRGTSLLCGATGNCQAWVFLRSQQQWRNLIQGPAPARFRPWIRRAGQFRPQESGVGDQRERPEGPLYPLPLRRLLRCRVSRQPHGRAQGDPSQMRALALTAREAALPPNTQ